MNAHVISCTIAIDFLFNAPKEALSLTQQLIKSAWNVISKQDLTIFIVTQGVSLAYLTN